MKKPLIIIAGPTACGKTDASLLLAKKINGEIISADSMQVYKYMDIGTAKIKTQEMQGIKHYLIDEFLPDEDFSIAKFKELATKYINQIYAKNKIPILVGGTGFYINSVIYNNDFKQTEKDELFRKNLENLAKEKGNLYLHKKLYEIDKESAEKIHPNNLKKVIRAIEFFNQTGEKISNHNKKEKCKEKAYETTFFILNMPREILYKKINMRVDLMIGNGLINEVKALLNMGYKKELVSMQGIGYKEIISYLEGNISLDEAIYIIKRDTRHFAKRQLTWFNHQVEDGIWLDCSKFENTKLLVDEMTKNLNNFN